MNLRLKRHHKSVAIPQYAKPGDAAIDLQAAIEEPITLQPHELAVISSGLAFEIPAGHFLLVAPRSSMGKRGLAMSNGIGIIDSGYRGEIFLQMRNISNAPITIQPLERLCQAVLMPFVTMQLEEADDLAETARGTAGLGSTGTH